ncbi:MAG: DUF3089 domain-containing protein, partial [Caulobacteraceae bacterium]|nr:DUF3089 domain-containing protein [Caulobacteraceae bacterium]
MRTPAVLTAAWVALLLSASSGAVAAATEGPAIDYSNPSNWLCRPDQDEACAGPLKAAVLSLAGAMTKRDLPPAAHDPPVDCFYVYPTVSREPWPNADMTA